VDKGFEHLRSSDGGSSTHISVSSPFAQPFSRREPEQARRNTDHSKGQTDAAKLRKQAGGGPPCVRGTAIDDSRAGAHGWSQPGAEKGELWRRRGWCRLESIAAKLSRRNMKITIVREPGYVLECAFYALQVPTTSMASLLQEPQLVMPSDGERKA
jgi:hypothetical protein